jgi:hypothetical protein
LVKTVEVKGDLKQGLVLHGLKEKPDLSSETYLTLSNQYYLDGYGRKVLINYKVEMVTEFYFKSVFSH